MISFNQSLAVHLRFKVLRTTAMKAAAGKKGLLWQLSLKWDNNIKIYIKKILCKAWTFFIWKGEGPSTERLLITAQSNFELHKTQESIGKLQWRW